MQRLTIKGQVTIPKRIRELLGLRVGHSAVDFVVAKDGTVVIRRAGEADGKSFVREEASLSRYWCDHVLGLLRGQCV